MEKSEIPKLRLHQPKLYPRPSLSSEPKSSRPAVWDCGSTLYDSFERTSFQRHLDSAIIANSARSLSMPHRTDLRVFPDLSRADSAPSTPRSKLSRSFQKLMRSVFSQSKSKTSKNADSVEEKKNRGIGYQDNKLLEKETARWFVVYEGDDGVSFEKDRKEKGAVLTTIAEVPEAEFKDNAPEVVKKSGLLLPETGAAVRKTMSERFTAASVSNRISSCA